MIRFASPSADFSLRSFTFYRVFSAVLLTDVVGPPVAYATLRHSLWLPYFIAGLSLVMSILIATLMPETLPDHGAKPYLNGGIDMAKFRAFVGKWKLVVALITIFLAQFRMNTIEILLPYVSVRFGWTIGQVRSKPHPHSFVKLTVLQDSNLAFYRLWCEFICFYYHSAISHSLPAQLCSFADTSNQFIRGSGEQCIFVIRSCRACSILQYHSAYIG